MSLIHKFMQSGNYYAIDVNSGSVHIIDELVYDILDENNIPNKDNIDKKLYEKYNKTDIDEAFEDINELVSEGLLYSEDLYKEIAVRDKSKSYIKALCLNIAHDCNLRCKYCFADEGEYQGKREIMSPETAKKAIDFVIKNSGPRKNIEVDLFGGEPLMAFETVKQVVEYAKEVEKLHGKNIRFTMTTNATLLTDEIMDYIDKNMGNIVLSIDGRKEVNDKVRVRVDGSGSHEKILKNIKEMVKRRTAGKQYYARGTFTHNNLDFYKDVIYLADEGFKEVSVEPVVLQKCDPLSLRDEDIDEIYQSYDKLVDEMASRIGTDKEFKFYHFNIDLNGGPCVYKRISGCGAGHEYVAITPSEDIYPCHQFVGNKDFIIGTLDEGIIKPEVCEDFKKAHIYNKPKCQNCWARFYCSGGCQANNYNFSGDIHEPYEFGCKLAKKRIECAIALKCMYEEKNA
ncbi:thioether cross-link-forming SCIFF peptide maturase [Clostridium oryzae]|uniref:Anaerobic sulfatase-maturating enzyme n=1 Tax=Clostridium oryzae TaxID=1450648 RepID=A0A1V4IU58_9CLOT|nr:thioether cross-link-forming SCIFF peptide maturase [Clostridium oryzae]OPJ63581.1 anaerobic sulfatase-maturating enzyme [Clostridium oryzae]